MKKTEAIIKAATEMFSQKPFHMVLMDDIAKTAGVAKGTLYYHYKSKEDLFIALMQSGLGELLKNLKTELEGNTPIENLQILFARLIRFFKQNHNFFEVLKREEGKLLSKKTKNCYERICSIKDLLHSILLKGVSEKYLRDDIDIDLSAEVILGMIKSFVSNRSYTEDSEKALFDLLLKGIQR
ncbi:MAG: TetR/AcrR family transcriptional regulator [Dissulfurispiraceae bacterium]|jgi:AcrR family transcriptional regulator|nr:TetR/AcrR family transcriptional regulator [Dissulfurispiraceae bacterium]